MRAAVTALFILAFFVAAPAVHAEPGDELQEDMMLRLREPQTAEPPPVVADQLEILLKQLNLPKRTQKQTPPEATAEPASEPAPVERILLNPPLEVTVRVLNRVTLDNVMLTVPVSKEADDLGKFGELDIRAHACDISPIASRDRALALLEIWERTPKTTFSPEGKRYVVERKKAVFQGWMVEGLSYINPFTHPVYDVTVLRCASRKEEAHG